MTPEHKNSCSSKHFKLACWITALVLSISVTVTIGITQATMGDTTQVEVRVRALESQMARQGAMLENVQRDTEYIRRQIDRERKPGP